MTLKILQTTMTSVFIPGHGNKNLIGQTIATWTTLKTLTTTMTSVFIRTFDSLPHVGSEFRAEFNYGHKNLIGLTIATWTALKTLPTTMMSVFILGHGNKNLIGQTIVTWQQRWHQFLYEHLIRCHMLGQNFALNSTMGIKIWLG